MYIRIYVYTTYYYISLSYMHIHTYNVYVSLYICMLCLFM